MQPGTVAVSGWFDGILVPPDALMICGSAPDPALPEAFRAVGAFAPGSQTRANRSPPTPQVWGSQTPSMALAAIAASTALPPVDRISIAACVLRSCDVTTTSPNVWASVVRSMQRSAYRRKLGTKRLTASSTARTAACASFGPTRADPTTTRSSPPVTMTI